MPDFWTINSSLTWWLHRLYIEPPLVAEPMAFQAAEPRMRGPEISAENPVRKPGIRWNVGTKNVE